MAVSGRLLWLSGLKQVADEGNRINFAGVNLKKENYVEKVKLNLTQYRDRAIENEKSILNLFGVSNLELLQERFQNFLNITGLIKLTGPQLYNTVLRQYETNIQAKDSNFYNWVQNVFLPRLLQKAETELPKDKKLEVYISEQIMESLAGIGVHRGGGKVKTGELYDAGRIVIEKLTENRQQKLLELYKKETGKTSVVNGDLTFENESSLNGQEIFSVTGTINYYKITEGKKQSEVTEEDLDKLTDILASELQNILSYGQANLPKNVIMSILGQKKENLKSFFVGKNVNDITGVLWELTTAAALQKLIPSANIDQILWAAKERSDGKQLSTDFIVKFINGVNIGIQVKNTTKDLDNLKVDDYFKIGFADANINLIFQKLEDKFPSLKKYSQTIKDAYISESFNIGYGINNGTYFATESVPEYYSPEAASRFNEFKSVKAQVSNVKSKIDTFLKMFAPDLLFMSIDKNFENSLAVLSKEAEKLVSGNNLYIIGNKPVFVSTILTSIINDLNKLEISVQQKNINLNDAKKFFTEEEGYASGTIIDYKNQYGGIGKNDKEAWKKLKQNLSIQNYQFTSSYLFE